MKTKWSMRNSKGKKKEIDTNAFVSRALKGPVDCKIEIVKTWDLLEELLHALSAVSFKESNILDFLNNNLLVLL